MRPSRSSFMEVFDAIAIVLSSALLMWLVLTDLTEPAGAKPWLKQALLVVGWLWALTVGVIVEAGRRRGKRVGPVAAVRQAFSGLPVVVVVVATAIWAIHQAFGFPSPFRAVSLLAAAVVLPRILLVIAVRAVGLDGFWRYGADRSIFVITCVGGGVVVPYLATAWIAQYLPPAGALLALAVIPLQAFVLAKVLVSLTEDFTHIDGLLSGLGRDLQPR